MKKYFCFLQIFLILFIYIKSIEYFGGYIEINKNNINNSDIKSWGERTTTPNSSNLDRGRCACNLTSLCDYRCCCDTDCDSYQINKWKNEDICIQSNKEILEEFECKNKRETFRHDNKNSTLFVNDHIFNIMCIQFKNIKDMGEFYSDEYSVEEINKLKRDWINNFFYKKK